MRPTCCELEARSTSAGGTYSILQEQEGKSTLTAWWKKNGRKKKKAGPPPGVAKLARPQFGEWGFLLLRVRGCTSHSVLGLKLNGLTSMCNDSFASLSPSTPSSPDAVGLIGMLGLWGLDEGTGFGNLCNDDRVTRVHHMQAERFK